MRAKTIMLQGTSSNVGKSLLCTALCRFFKQEGFKTAPFKAQNMALNSFVTPDGCEIGRAQGIQAIAAGVLPKPEMNPLLLKPKEDMVAEIIELGKPVAQLSAREYRSSYLSNAEPLILDCINKLRSEFEVLVIEGAGSPAEINLKDKDIVNMKTAELAEAPVLLIADIDRGGVFASLIGTLELLEPKERNKIKGFIINKFRGDLSLLQPGLDFLEARTGIPVLGVLPYMHNHGIDEEDSVSLEEKRVLGDPNGNVQIAVIQLPRISNFTDFNPLSRVPDLCVRFIKEGEKIGDVDAVIIPGTKSPIEDMQYLRSNSYDQEIIELSNQERFVIGICGGYQMLGNKLIDPFEEDLQTSETDGLNLFNYVTEYKKDKTVHQVEAIMECNQGFFKSLKGEKVFGYEIHQGHIKEDNLNPLLHIYSQSGEKVRVMDGRANNTGKVFGTHVHGLFENTNILLALINSIRYQKGLSQFNESDLGQSSEDENFDQLANTLKKSLNMHKIFEIMNLGDSK
ncbi:Cobyric acid synthase [Candidatus Syntrophocurvum alkaliphilum]|uniref:Cobyric acid synthase n=1 Tax=Candidatus Syntrophocurvum alkaliphilum TaxID=2293317 RepID=A0A6I6DGN9_9FIRM|nr:cobyric acid synthase [Candidatus Syntrophocurvum alkaliphilum]QGU00257.1 Cobyric acid synthase [Candidatus Syntrophocurvum alkaliphilum]